MLSQFSLTVWEYVYHSHFTDEENKTWIGHILNQYHRTSQVMIRLGLLPPNCNIRHTWGEDHTFYFFTVIFKIPDNIPHDIRHKDILFRKAKGWTVFFQCLFSSHSLFSSFLCLATLLFNFSVLFSLFLHRLMTLSTGGHNAIYICAAPFTYKECLPMSGHWIHLILLKILWSVVIAVSRWGNRLS